MTALQVKYPVAYEDSLNAVLLQEVARFNALTSTVRASLDELLRAIKGSGLTSAEAESTSEALLVGRVPPAWLARSYPTLKPLAAFLSDLLERLKFFQVRSQPKRIDCLFY